MSVSVHASDRDWNKGAAREKRQLRTAAGELALFLILFGLACALLGTETVFSFEPNPLWLPVILLSVQHGAAAGLAAAASGVLMTFLFDWPGAPIPGQDYYAQWLSVSWEPALWVASAVLIGATRDWQINETGELEANLRDARKVAAELNDYAGQLTERIGELERHVAAGSRPEADLLEPLLTFRNTRAPLKRRTPKLFEALFGDGRYEFNRIHPDRTARAPDIEPGRIYSLFDTDNDVAASAAALFVCAVQSPTGSIFGELAIMRIGEERWGADIDRRVALFVMEIEAAIAGHGRPIPLRDRKKKTKPLKKTARTSQRSRKPPAPARSLQ